MSDKLALGCEVAPGAVLTREKTGLCDILNPGLEDTTSLVCSGGPTISSILLGRPILLLSKHSTLLLYIREIYFLNTPFPPVV